MMFYVPKILIGICILGIIGSIFQLYQTKQTLNGSKIRFKRFLLLGVIFYLNDSFKRIIRRFERQ